MSWFLPVGRQASEFTMTFWFYYASGDSRLILLPKRQHLVRFLDKAQEIGHGRNGTGRAFGLRSALETAPAGKELTSEISKLPYLPGDIEMLGVGNALKLHPLAQEENTHVVLCLPRRNREPQRVPHVLRRI